MLSQKQPLGNKLRRYALVTLLLAVGLLWASCKPKQVAKTVTESKTQKDSVHIEVREVLRAIPVLIPVDSASIKALVKCPDGGQPIIIYKADTTKHAQDKGNKGRAQVDLSIDNKGNLVAKATCDELEQLVYAKDRIINYWTGRYQAYEKQEKTTYTTRYIPAWVWWLLGGNILFFLLCCLGTFLYLKHKLSPLPI